MLIEIKHYTGNTLHTVEADNLKAALKALVKNGADLRGAYLGGADLRGADLRGAYLGGADLRGAYLGGADLTGADLGGAYLGGADLTGADLGGAYLGGADLGGADLGGATYGEGVPLTKTPIQLLGLTWPIFIFDTQLKIGCELHSFTDWEKFTDSRIKKMDMAALPWWKIHKSMIMAMIKVTRPEEEAKTP